MLYTLIIKFPGDQGASLTAQTIDEVQEMEAALIALKAEYVIHGPKWTGFSFNMTSAAYEIFDRVTAPPPCH